jgi:transcription termination/antitermination protein NusA
MKSEFILAFNEIAETRKLPRDVILDALKAALVSAYRRAVNIGSAQAVEARIDERTGNPSIWAEKEVVEDVENDLTEVALDQAREWYDDVQSGDLVFAECTPPANFGRIAAQTAKQVILQRMREAEREAQYAEYQERVGDLVTGTVQSSQGGVVTIGLGRTEAILPRNQQVPGERYRTHDKVRAYVMEVKKTSRGPQIVVSRTHRNMLRRLLEYEVPEIYNGSVDIKSIAREPGARSKVAVAALQEGADPVGACVGMRGVRIQSIVKELNGEKIDVIEWNQDQSQFISKALSPARVSIVFLDDDPDEGRTAIVVVPDDQLSLAIGREGQNARLAAKLTGWRIDIKSITEAAQEVREQVEAEPNLIELKDEYADLFTQVDYILEKRATNRPVTPEEYQSLTQFITRVENFRLGLKEGRRVERRAQREAAREQIPVQAFDHPLDDTDLPLRVYNALAEAGFQSVGEVMEAFYVNPDRLRNLPGVGASAYDSIRQMVDTIDFGQGEVAESVFEEEAFAPAVEPVAEYEAAAEEYTPQSDSAVSYDDTEEELARAERAALVARIAAGIPIEDVGAEYEPVPEVVETRVPEESVEEIAARLALGLAGGVVEEETEDEDSDDQGDRAGGKKDKKGRRQLVFDEDAGRVVAKKKRKPGRAREQWEDYID